MNGVMPQYKSFRKTEFTQGIWVNHKCEIVNYKTKELQPLLKEHFIIVPNTHEPLVSRENFEQVQILIKSRPSPSVYETENLFCVVLVCSE
jgi:hypothetical protein